MHSLHRHTKSRGCSRLRTGLLLSFLLILLLPACGGDHEARIDSGADPLLIGTYEEFEVIDGDTFHIGGLTRGIRFLNIDTEETPKNEDAAEMVESIAETWPDFYFQRRGGGAFPVKSWSPFGYETAEWAREWFSSVDSVRLERDTPDERFGFFERYLAYVIAYRAGEEINYNVECVRMGYSPYFTKYGYSRRYHAEFLRAQEEAITAHRGIWNDSTLCYPDYQERLSWWNSRAGQIASFDSLFSNGGAVFLGRDGAYEKLLEEEGDRVVVFATAGEAMTDRFPYYIELPIKKDLSAYLYFPEEASAVFGNVPWQRLAQRYFYAVGTVEEKSGKIVIVIDDDGYVGLDPPSSPSS
jgi:endonuclease YncB( thermonuclease family)